MDRIPRLYEALLADQLQRDRQMVFLSGPRQVGKTTSAQGLRESLPPARYLSWDDEEARRLILAGQQAVARALGLDTLREVAPLCVFDEMHKFAEWKNFLKGFFDRYQNRVRILVTGSARLDLYRRGGDSLIGRYFPYRMHPLSLGELAHPSRSEKWFHEPRDLGESTLRRLLDHGGFPEPFQTSDAAFTRRWRQTRTDLVFREDLRDATNLSDLARVRMLAALIEERAGRLAGFSSYARDVRVASDTVRRWTEILESFYFCFSLRPWHKNLTRALRKEPKFYLWDWSGLRRPGARFENLVASALLKSAHGWTDQGQANVELFFVRDKEKREVDFLLVRDGSPWILVEAETGANQGLSKPLLHYHKLLGTQHALQVVRDLPHVDADCFGHTDPIQVPALTFLSQLL